MAQRGRPSNRSTVEVMFLPQGGSITTVKVRRGSTLKAAIGKAGFDPKTTEARNGDLVLSPDTLVQECQQVVLLPEGKIEGGII